jgi:hypothetical protein
MKSKETFESFDEPLFIRILFWFIETWLGKTVVISILMFLMIWVHFSKLETQDKVYTITTENKTWYVNSYVEGMNGIMIEGAECKAVFIPWVEIESIRNNVKSEGD